MLNTIGFTHNPTIFCYHNNYLFSFIPKANKNYYTRSVLLLGSKKEQFDLFFYLNKVNFM
mgnify:CR=1 FL=1